jgi:hypothetical protein
MKHLIFIQYTTTHQTSISEEFRNVDVGFLSGKEGIFPKYVTFHKIEFYMTSSFANWQFEDHGTLFILLVLLLVAKVDCFIRM